MSHDPILQDLRVGLRRRSERRRRVRAASAASAAVAVMAGGGLSALQQSTPTAPATGAAGSTAPVYFQPVSGDCFTTLAACGLSDGRI